MSKIVPTLWYDGKAEEAARFYVSLLPDSRIDEVVSFGGDTPGGAAGTVMLVEFTLAGQRYTALNGGPRHRFTPAVSLAVMCDDQAEVDRLWDALCDRPERCGWLRDRWGLSWQIVPKALPPMMRDPDPARARRVTEALMGMVKLDIAALRKAWEGT